MPTQLLAIIKDGKIQTLDSIDLPEGTELLVTIESDLEALAWSDLSLNSLTRRRSSDINLVSYSSHC
jgi:hypothetical protein